MEASGERRARLKGAPGADMSTLLTVYGLQSRLSFEDTVSQGNGDPR